MSNECKVDCGRRRLVVATAAVGGVGAVAALVPFVSSMLPSGAGQGCRCSGRSRYQQARTRSDDDRRMAWQAGVDHQSHAGNAGTLPKLDDQVADPKSEKKMQPDYAKNENRSIKPEIMVMVGICTHLGCSPSSKFKKGSEEGMSGDWLGGFCARAMARPSISPAASSKANRRRTTSKFRRTTTSADGRILIGEDKKGPKPWRTPISKSTSRMVPLQGNVLGGLMPASR